MSPTLRAKIIIVLTAYLNREPTESEIINAQTDVIIMSKVNQLP